MQEMIDCLIEEANRCRGLATISGAEMFRDAYLHKAELFERAADVLRKVEAIKPHGRLIDADELHSVLRKRAKEFSDSEYGTGVKCGLADAREYIKIAPTIIPAEGQP